MDQQCHLPFECSYLVDKYFAKYLRRLVTTRLSARDDCSQDGRFIRAAYSPEALETRLQRIEHLGLTPKLLAEVGDIGDPIELDRRLMDVWAEIRVLDQLQREGYTRIEKVTEIADFVAHRCEHSVAFQVTRLNKLLTAEIDRRNPPELRDRSTYGIIQNIHKRLDTPTWYLFRDRIEAKNGKFTKWPADGSTRCIVVVSNEGNLQHDMQYHITCQQIRASIHELPIANFEELLWLPDDGNGAWFYVGETAKETTCWADWSDEPIVNANRTLPSWAKVVRRRQVDLDCDIPSWLDERS